MLDGALLAANDNLRLDTGTLGFSDIADHDESDDKQATIGFNSANIGGALKGASISGEVSSHNREQITRATVGEGEITVRDEANQQQDVAALNRDVGAAQEITRDESAGVEFYASTSAIEEIASGFEGVQGNIKALVEQAEKGFPAFTEGLTKIAKDLSRLTPNHMLTAPKGSAVVQSLKQSVLDQGADKEVVETLFGNAKFVNNLSNSVTALGSAEKNGWNHKVGPEPRQPIYDGGPAISITLDTRMSDGEKFLYSLGELRTAISSLPPEQVQIASLTLQAAIAGPFGAVKGYLVETAKDWAVGAFVEKVTASTTQVIHDTLTGKKWDAEYGWTGESMTQNGARLAAELLIGGVAPGGGAKVGKGSIANSESLQKQRSANGENNRDHGYYQKPDKINGFPGLVRDKPKTSVQGGGGLRNRWKDRDGNIYEWDRQHGTLEKYNKRGKHLGEFDPQTGQQTKPADKNRKVEP